VLHASLLDTAFTYAADGVASQRVALSIGRLQVDSSIPKAKFPTMLAPLPVEGQPARATLSLEVEHNRALSSESMLYLERLDAVLQPLQVTLEQNTLTRLLRFVQHASAVSAKLAKKEDAPASGADGAPGGGGDDDAAVARAEGPRLYLKAFKLRPIVVTVTVELAALTDEPELQAYHPTRKLVGLAKNLASINAATINLDMVELSEANMSVDALAQKLQDLYTMQVLISIYKLVGSLDFIGNPAAVFSDVGGGFKAFFAEPKKGLDESPSAFVGGVAKGTRGLAGGIAGGLAAGFTGVISTGANQIRTVAGGLALDPQFDLQQQQVAQEKANTAKQGFRLGGRQLADGFRSGAAGIVQQPVRGAMSGGFVGGVGGLGRGLVGAVTKPVAGMAGFTSKWTEGLASDAKKLTPDAMKAAQQLRVLRVRQPRLIGPDGVMRTYARVPPIEGASGLRWRNIGGGRPTGGRELTNERLRDALAGLLPEFGQTEWDAFGVTDLRADAFILSGGAYFQPVEAEEAAR